jgi:S1-C subfamily serine protease
MLKLRMILALLVLAVVAGAAPSPAPGASTELAKKLYEQASPSLVAVKYTWESELGRRELVGPGVVVSEDGLVMVPLSVFDMRIPDEQLKEFLLVVAHEDRDAEEIEAQLLGRDERTNLAFLKPKADPGSKSESESKSESKSRSWKPIKFEEDPVQVGQPVYSVGILPEMANYKPYFMEAAVAATLRGETPQVLVNGGLAAVGSPVFNADGKAIGVVAWQPGQPVFLNDPSNPLNAVTLPPKFYVPTRDFALALSDPPKAGEPQKLPWIGVPQLTGVNKDVAEVLGLTNKPAIEIGEVIPNTPAEKAGLKQGMIIVKMNGEPLERGDEPEELPQILRRKLLRMKVGDPVTFTVMTGKDQPTQDIKVTLEEQPRRQNTARRWFAEDLGFSVRESVFLDTYQRRLPPDAKGVIVSLIRPQSAAQAGELRREDLITELNREPVTDLDQFRKSYEEFRKAKPREAVVMVVQREGNTKVIRIEPPQ